MNKTCKQCKAGLESNPNTDYIVTNGICSHCIETIFDDQDNSISTFLNNIDSPVLLMQPDPRQVRTANKISCELFEKDLSQIKGLRGGQVFNCIHAFTKAGCGKDENCEDCKIKNSLVDTFTNGTSHDGVSTNLDIKTNTSVMPYHLKVSTEKIGDLALIRIDNYKKKS